MHDSVAWVSTRLRICPTFLSVEFDVLLQLGIPDLKEECGGTAFTCQFEELVDGFWDAVSLCQGRRCTILLQSTSGHFSKEIESYWTEFAVLSDECDKTVTELTSGGRA